ncbi:MAG TPA: hypothetical protein VF318_05430 [Dehalococcoidales bacterium]
MKIGTNPNRRIALACGLIVVVGILMIFLPGLTGMDGFNGGYAISLFGSFIAIVGIIAVVVFWRLANLQDTVLNEKGILAHWTYSPDEWRQYIAKEHAEDKSDKRSLFLMVAVISIIVGIILFFVYPDDRLVTFYTILGIIVVIGITAMLSTAAVFNWNKRHPGEIYFARDGAYFSGRLHIWKGLGARLDGITYEDTKTSPRIVVKYSSPNMLAGNRYVVRVPVPQGQEQAARKVVSDIQSSHRS